VCVCGGGGGGAGAGEEASKSSMPRSYEQRNLYLSFCQHGSTKKKKWRHTTKGNGYVCGPRKRRISLWFIQYILLSLPLVSGERTLKRTRVPHS